MQGNDESIAPQNSNTTTVSTGEADKDLIRMAEHAAARKCELNPYVGMMAEHHDHPAQPAK